MAQLDLSIILPAYNVESSILQTLTILLSQGGRFGSYEIIVVDDGSSDGTAARVTDMSHPHVRIESSRTNRGKGAAIKRGIAVASGRYLIMTDADLPYGVRGIDDCRAALKDAALVVGDRTLRPDGGVPVHPVRQRLSDAFATLVSPLVGMSGIRDTQCGLKGMEAEFARAFLPHSAIDRFAFDVELIVFALENGFAVRRVPVTLVRNDASTVRPVMDGPNVLADVLRIGWRRWRSRYRRGRADR